MGMFAVYTKLRVHLPLLGYSWAKVLGMLCNPGEMYLAEEWTYPSAKATAKPQGVNPVPIQMDGEGMRSDHLRKVLSEWSEVERGAPRYFLY